MGRHYFHLHLISDATGETLIAASRAVAAQYDGVLLLERVYPLVRSKGQLDKAIAEIEAAPGIVLFTLVDQDLAAHLEAACKELSVPCLSVLQPIVNLFQSYIGMASRPRPGAQHMLNAEYFKRIEALNFTMMHDDGQQTENFEAADVVLLGVSRTSKTPTSIYLANRGVKTANIPLVPDVPLPEPVLALRNPLVVGLLASVERIVQISRESPYRAERKPRFTLCRPPPSRRRTRAGPQALRRARLAGHRCDASLDRGNRGGGHRSLQDSPVEIHSLAMTGFWRGTTPLVLASQSSARQGLFSAAGIPVEICAAAIDERGVEAPLVASGAAAGEIALHLSRAKALAVSREMPGRLVVGADQTLCVEGLVFGKPAGRAAARAQLEALSSRTHGLFSGCCAARENTVLFETVGVARLSCRRLSPAFIDAYLTNVGDALLGNAGAYQVEGLGIHLFDAIEGDHATILGLPLLPLLKFLREEGSLLS